MLRSRAAVKALRPKGSSGDAFPPAKGSLRAMCIGVGAFKAAVCTLLEPPAARAKGGVPSKGCHCVCLQPSWVHRAHMAWMPQPLQLAKERARTPRMRHATCACYCRLMPVHMCVCL